MEITVGWVFTMLLWWSMGLLAVCGLIYLQFYTSSRSDWYWGLVLPALYLPTFATSVYLTDIMGAYNLWSTLLIMLVLLGIYGYCRFKIYKNNLPVDPEELYDKVDNHINKAVEMLYLDLDYDKITAEHREVAKRYAVNHLGFLLTWVVEHELLNEDLIVEKELENPQERTISPEDLAGLLSGERMGADVVLEGLQGFLLSSDLMPAGAGFVDWYFEENFFRNYSAWADRNGGLYQVKPSFEGYEDFRKIINQRFRDYEKKHPTFGMLLHKDFHELEENLPKSAF